MVRFLYLALLLAASCACDGFGQDSSPNQRALHDDVSALIDKLQDIDQEGLGYMSTVSGMDFLPLGISEPGSMLLFQKPPKTSDTLRELVKKGARAVPQLIAHLNDQRPTKITIEHKGGIGGMFFEDEYDYNRRTAKEPPAGVNREIGSDTTNQTVHRVTVGDLCFVALGQIVNRRFEAVRYQPTLCVMINSPTDSEVLRHAIEKEWSNLTPEQHKASLIRDLLEADDIFRRSGACLRLGYYYPAELEALVVRELAKPRYDFWEVYKLIHEKLYRANRSTERKALFDAFVAVHGDVARQGILVQLFDDLSVQEADEEGRWSEHMREKYRARTCLVELYAYSANVKSDKRPRILPLDDGSQAKLIDTLVYFPSPDIDHAVKAMLLSTTNNQLAGACARYLVGRGADADISRYLERHLKDAKNYERKELEVMQDHLGWTLLHMAGERDDSDQVQKLIGQGYDVNARAANGQTALHVAAGHGNLGPMRILLAHKADPNIKDRQGRTAVQMAIEHDQAVEMLLAAHAEPSDILVASFAGRADLVRRFLAGDKTLKDLKTTQDETPLHIAARRGQDKVAAVLLDYGADPNAADSNKVRPLHWAAYRGDREIVALLLAHKADPKARDGYNRTPLDLARKGKDTKTIRLLEEAP